MVRSPTVDIYDVPRLFIDGSISPFLTSPRTRSDNNNILHTDHLLRPSMHGSTGFLFQLVTQPLMPLHFVFLAAQIEISNTHQ